MAETDPITSAPGRVCPGAKLMVPLALKERPVLVAAAVVVEESRFSVAEGAAVLLPVSTACHSKRGLTGALLEEL